MQDYLARLHLPPHGLHPWWQQTTDLYIKALYAMVRQEKPKTVVELGTYRGFSTSAIAEALKLNREEGWNGHLWTVDLRQDHAWQCPEPLVPFVTVVEGNTQDPALRDRLVPGEPTIDLLFVDADHSWENTRKDFLCWLEACRYGGLVAFHDIRPLFGHVEGSARHWDETKARWPEATSDMPDCQMGVLRLPTEVDAFLDWQAELEQELRAMTQGVMTGGGA